MVTVDELAQTLNELAAKVQSLEGLVDGNQLTMEDELRNLRSIVANTIEKGMDGRSRAGHTSLRDAEKFIPDQWTGERGARPFNDFKADVLNYISAFAPDADGESIMAWIVGETKAKNVIDDDAIEAQVGEHPLIQKINRALHQMLMKCTSDTAKLKVRQCKTGAGIRALQSLLSYYAAGNARDQAISITSILSPHRCKNAMELHKGLAEWEVALRDHESRFEEYLPDSLKTAAVLQMIPNDIFDSRFKGRAFNTFTDLRDELGEYLIDKRPHPGRGGGTMDEIGEDEDRVGKLMAEVAELNALIKGKGRGSYVPGKGSGSPYSIGKGGGTGRPGKGVGKTNDGGAGGAKGPGKGEVVKNPNIECWGCGGTGHPKRLCPYRKSLNAMEEVDGDEYGRWEADALDLCLMEDETREVRMPAPKRPCSESCSARAPKTTVQAAQNTPATPQKTQALRLAQVARQRKHAATSGKQRQPTSHNEMMMLGADEESPGEINEMARAPLDSPDGKWVRVAAVVDSGAVESAMPVEVLPEIATEPSPGSKQGKVYRCAGGTEIPNLGQKKFTLKTAEGQSRVSCWQVCPVRRPLLSVAQMNKVGNAVVLDDENPHIKHKRTGEITKLRKQGNVFVLDFWALAPTAKACQNGGVAPVFGRPGR